MTQETQIKLNLLERICSSEERMDMVSNILATQGLYLGGIILWDSYYKENPLPNFLVGSAFILAGAVVKLYANNIRNYFAKND